MPLPVNKKMLQSSFTFTQIKEIEPMNIEIHEYSWILHILKLA